MAVAVQQVSRAPKQKRDLLDTLITGLNVANQVYGIKTNMEKLDMMKQDQLAKQQQIATQQEEKARTDAGILTPGQARQLEFQGGRSVEVGTPGAIETPVQTAEGQIEKRYFISPKAAEQEKQATLMAQKIAKEEKASAEKKSTALRNEYTKASNDTFDALKAFRKVESAATTPNPTGASDVALVFGYMKTIDPTSTVREGEFATAEQTGGVPNQIISTYNKLINGERLAPVQRENFLNSAREQIQSQLDVQKETDQRFMQLSKQANVDSERVINPIFQSLSDELAKGIQKQSQALSGGGPSFIGITNEAQANQIDKKQSAMDAFLSE